jgi:hypothetical protein
MFVLSANDVDDGEDDDPDGIDEMPIPGEKLNSALLLLDVALEQSGDHDQREKDQANDDVRGMQTDERIVSGAE